MLLYITGGVGFVLSILAIFLLRLFHKKDKKKRIPIILYVVGFILFMGSGFLHWRGFELHLPVKEPVEDTADADSADTADTADTADNADAANG